MLLLVVLLDLLANFVGLLPGVIGLFLHRRSGLFALGAAVVGAAVLVVSRFQNGIRTSPGGYALLQDGSLWGLR